MAVACGLRVALLDLRPSSHSHLLLHPLQKVRPIGFQHLFQLETLHTCAQVQVAWLPVLHSMDTGARLLTKPLT